MCGWGEGREEREGRGREGRREGRGGERGGEERGEGRREGGQYNKQQFRTHPTDSHTHPTDSPTHHFNDINFSGDPELVEECGKVFLHLDAVVLHLCRLCQGLS